MNNIATLIRDGKLDEARSELEGQSGDVKQTADWHYQKGLLFDAQGEIDEAMDAYEEALKLDAEHTEATFRLAYDLDLYGEDDRAIDLYESLTSRTPAHVNALLNLATIYEDSGDFEGAYSCVDRVLADYPEHPRARMFLKDIESSMTMHYDEAQERTRAKRNAILDTPVSDFELSVRSRNCLKKMNIDTLGDLLRITEPELLAYKNFGETSLSEIKAMLKQKGLRLGQLKEEESRGPRPRTGTPRRAGADGPPELLNKYLSEIEFSSRSRKCLQRLGLMTLGDLTTKSEAELLSAKNFGQTSLNEIKQKLGEFGLTLRKSD
jgi:DNA-directed RNA polymerase subunit alpha